MSLSLIVEKHSSIQAMILQMVCKSFSKQCFSRHTCSTGSSKPLQGNSYDYELATKLSYNLCNRPPDDLIKKALADNGNLKEELEAQATRLLNEPCGEELILSLHRQLMHTETYDNIVRDDPDWDSLLNHDMEMEVDLFIAEALYAENGGLRRLLTADYTVANHSIGCHLWH